MTTLEQAIQKSGLKRRVLSEKVGVSTGTIKNWETKRTIPNIVQAEKLANTLNVKVSDILYFFSHNVDDMETKER